MLELKEIQRSLPHAPQPLHDPDLPDLNARGVPRTHFLNTVPVGLVPLISPDTSTLRPQSTSIPSVVHKPKTELPTSLPSRPPPSPPSTPPPNISVTSPHSSHNLDPPKRSLPRSPAVEPWVPPPPPPRLPYNIPIQPRPVPRFNFLPLLESPVSPVPSVALRSNSPPRRESLPPSSSNSPVPLPPCLENIALDHTPCPPFPSLLQSGHGVGPTGSSRNPLAGISTANTPTKSSRLGKLDQPINTRTAQLLPPSPLSSTPSPGDEKESVYDDTTCLQAELSHLWRRQSCHIDTEAETESEAESSVVHTEAESDSENTRSVAALSRVTKASRTPVAVVTAADGNDDEEGEMSLIELESGVMAFVRVPRRK